MNKYIIDSVVGKLIDYKYSWYSENAFTYEGETVYIVFSKINENSISDNQQVIYLYVVNNLSKIINRSLQMIKNLFYEDKLKKVRFNQINIDNTNLFAVSMYFLDENFEFDIQFNTKGDIVKFGNDKII